MLLWIFVWVPLALIFYTAITLGILKVIAKNVNDGYQGNGGSAQKQVQLVVLGDEESEVYQDFIVLTYELEKVRKEIKRVDLNEEQRVETTKEVDKLLKELQEAMIYIQTEGNPNPDLLSKAYYQDLTVQILKLRLEFEKLMGYNFETETEFTEADVHIFKMIPIGEDKDGNGKNNA